MFKVRNRLDDAYYAIKKIVLKHRHQDLFVKILREVTTLAQVSMNAPFQSLSFFCSKKLPHIFIQWESEFHTESVFRSFTFLVTI